MTTALPSKTMSWSPLGRPFGAFTAAVVCLALLIATGIAAWVLPAAQRPDVVALRGFSQLDTPPLAQAAGLATTAFNTVPYALLGAGLLAWAAWQRQPRKLRAAAVVLVGAPASSEILKPILGIRPEPFSSLDLHVSAGSWPSGHATAAMAFALCAVLIAPARWRPLTWVLGATLTTLVSYSILALGWHFPSDVLGGDLMAGFWALLSITMLDVGGSRWATYARPPRLKIRFSEVTAAVVLALTLADVLTSTHVKNLLTSHMAFVAGAALITLLAVALPSIVGKVAPGHLDT